MIGVIDVVQESGRKKSVFKGSSYYNNKVIQQSVCTTSLKELSSLLHHCESVNRSTITVNNNEYELM